MKRSWAQKWRDDFRLMASKYATDPFSGNRIWHKGPKVQTVSMTELKVSVDVGLKTEIALSPPVLASPHHPLQRSSDCPQDLQMGEVTTLVGFETRYIVISVSIPVTISAALILCGAYSRLCKTSRLFVLLSALKRTLNSCSRLLWNYPSPLRARAAEKDGSVRWCLRPDFKWNLAFLFFTPFPSTWF